MGLDLNAVLNGALGPLDSFTPIKTSKTPEKESPTKIKKDNRAALVKAAIENNIDEFRKILKDVESRKEITPIE